MKRPNRDDVLVFRTTSDLRRWFEANHDQAREAWIGYYRKGAGKASVSYPEAVDEALCFGWIDGLTYRVDDEVHTNRFTPRRKGSTWSLINVRRMGDLIAAGRAHPAGLAAFDGRTEARTGLYSYENRPAELPPEYAARLRGEAAAWAWWQGQTPGYRKGATWWVVSAKREDTRLRRLEQLIEDSAAGRKIAPLRERVASTP